MLTLLLEPRDAPRGRRSGCHDLFDGHESVIGDDLDVDTSTQRCDNGMKKGWRRDVGSSQEDFVLRFRDELQSVSIQWGAWRRQMLLPGKESNSRIGMMGRWEDFEGTW